MILPVDVTEDTVIIPTRLHNGIVDLLKRTGYKDKIKDIKAVRNIMHGAGITASLRDCKEYVEAYKTYNFDN